MSRFLLLALLVGAAGCQEGSKPPTQTGPKAVEIQTTVPAATSTR